MTLTDAKTEVARLTECRKSTKARRETAYAAGATALAIGLEDELVAMVERVDSLWSEFGLGEEELDFGWPTETTAEIEGELELA